MINFGTSGWRAVMGEEFTFHNVRLCVQAIANVLHGKFPAGTSASSSTTTPASCPSATPSRRPRSCRTTASGFSWRSATRPPRPRPARSSAAGPRAGSTSRPPSTRPSTTASSTTPRRAPRPLPEETEAIEAEIRELEKGFDFFPRYPRSEAIERIDLREDYLEFLQKKIDFDGHPRSGLRIGVDLLYGTSREYLDEILEDNGIPIEEIHGYIDPYFGGIAPSCTEENLAELKRLVRDKKCDLGLATDADGDRFGIVDREGTFVLQNLILALLLQYLVDPEGLAGRRGPLGRDDPPDRPHRPAARPAALSNARRVQVHRRPLPPGPDHLRRRGERLPRRQGPPPREGRHHRRPAGGRDGRRLGQEPLGDPEGPLQGVRRAGRRPEDPAADAGPGESPEGLLENPPSALGCRKVEAVETMDGIKLDFADDAWLLLRFSGTEPLIRCYAEAASSRELDDLLARGMELVS